ncbi:hypothetical protein PR202_ga09070 [Eleusine coracana subsp. coracana]|uniref:AB hydrolase-1 domain-containing protein n=1 Tax=Eleusine coracana subsp. coracana TaxID=191504 RepID=A0AAV5C4S1_ELECO|nr:hypothetical protein PR202_ga09070 [Eleusine coracana subsp. coracana]
MAACGASPAAWRTWRRSRSTAGRCSTSGEKAVIVDHSFGGLSLALAMERYPDMDKVAVVVFVSADDRHVRGREAHDARARTAYDTSKRWFLDDTVMTENVLTVERYGAVRRVYVVAEDDATWSAKFQHRTTSWNPGTEVRGLQGADHMPMFSKLRDTLR